MITWSRFGLLGWNFNSSSRDRFHCTIIWENQIILKNFIPAWQDSFSPGICLVLFTFSMYHSVLNYCFTPLRQAELIAWDSSKQSGIPAVQKRDPALPGWNFPHVITGHNLWRVCNTAVYPGKRDKISSRPSGIIQPPPVL